MSINIKHLVIPGGSSLGISYLAILKKLNEYNFWNINNIENIYATSVGSIIACMICLKLDWSLIETYIIERPWQNVFQITINKIFNFFNNKGLFDEQFILEILNPLMKVNNIDNKITLKEFYIYSKISLHIFTTNLNTFESIEITHESHPDLSLIKCISMSSALPGLFMPIFHDDVCYVDGGILNNFPLNSCINHFPNDIQNIFAINSISLNTQIKNINKNVDIIDYIYYFVVKLTNHIRKVNENITIHIPYQINFIKDNETQDISFNFLYKCMNDQNIRKFLWNKGILCAEDFWKINLKHFE